MQVPNIQARHIYLTSLFYCKLHGGPKINVQCKNHPYLEDLVGRGKATPRFLVELLNKFPFPSCIAGEM